MRRLRTRDLKALAEQELESYDDEMIEELTNQLIDYLDGISIEEIDATEVYDLIEAWETDLPDPGEWAFSQVESKIDDYNDQAYNQMKEERAFGK